MHTPQVLAAHIADIMGTAEFWIPAFWLFSASLLAYFNYRDLKRGEWDWRCLIVTVLILGLLIAILYPTIARNQPLLKWAAPFLSSRP